MADFTDYIAKTLCNMIYYCKLLTRTAKNPLI